MDCESAGASREVVPIENGLAAPELNGVATRIGLCPSHPVVPIENGLAAPELNGVAIPIGLCPSHPVDGRGPALALGVLAIGIRGRFQDVLVIALILLGLYTLAKLLERRGWGHRRTPQWRFVGRAGPDAQGGVVRRPDRHGHEDPFQVLQIAPTDDLDQISSAYIHLAKKTHPDLHPGDRRAKEKFQRVQRAFSEVGDEAALRLYLMDHPLDQPLESPEGPSASAVVELYQFQHKVASFRASWRLKQAAAERHMMYLAGPASVRAATRWKLYEWLARHFGRSSREKILVERVWFLSSNQENGRKVPHLEIYGKLLRVGTQEELRAVVAFLLASNHVDFVDQFHTGDTVSFHALGRRLGQSAALSPTASYAELVTNLAKLGLYNGPDVERTR
jgi:hypothetical protein